MSDDDVVVDDDAAGDEREIAMRRREVIFLIMMCRCVNLLIDALLPKLKTDGRLQKFFSSS